MSGSAERSAIAATERYAGFRTEAGGRAVSSPDQIRREGPDPYPPPKFLDEPLVRPERILLPYAPNELTIQAFPQTPQPGKDYLSE